MLKELTTEEQHKRHMDASELVREYREDRRISEEELPLSLAFLTVCKEAEVSEWKDKYERKVTELQSLEVQFTAMKTVLDYH